MKRIHCKSCPWEISVPDDIWESTSADTHGVFNAETLTMKTCGPLVIDENQYRDNPSR